MYAISLLVVGLICASGPAPRVSELTTLRLIGIVALWNRDNLLIFEDEAIKFESDAISGIVGFTDHQIIVEDVFGVIQVIDLAKIETNRKVVATFPYRVSFSKLQLPRLHLLSRANLGKPRYVEPHDVLLGIGIQSRANRLYETKFDKTSKETTITQRVKPQPAGGSPNAISFKLQGDVTPVLVRNRREILFIGEDPRTDHFGPLMYRFNAKNTIIEDSALWFLPLRMAKKWSGH